MGVIVRLPIGLVGDDAFERHAARPRRPLRLIPARACAANRATYIQMNMTSDQATSATIGPSSRTVMHEKPSPG